ncbi:MAG: O-antigen ligase family protein [Actinomycetota bacterium]|nr:O-antigen ligase family protein [Actinomycetota bacterium]
MHAKGIFRQIDKRYTLNSVTVVKGIAPSTNAQRSILYMIIILAVTGSAFFSIEIGPFVLSPYRILLCLLWLLFFADILASRAYPDISHIKVKPYMQFLAFWFSYAVASFLWADSKIGAVKHIILLFLGMSIIFFVVFCFTRLADFKRFYNLWLIALIIALTIGFWNQIAGQQLFKYQGDSRQIEQFMHVPRATFYNQNDYATFLALSIPFVVAFIRHSTFKHRLSLGMGLLIPALHQLLATQSRANYIALALGGVFWFSFLLKAKEKLKLLAVSVVVMLAIVIAFPGYAYDSYLCMQGQMGSFFNGQPIDGSTNFRINLIKNSLVLLGKHYGLGVGAGNAEYHIANFGVYDTGGTINVHNWWVEVLTDYGIIVFMGYMIFYLNLLVSLYRTYNRLENSEKMICEALLMGLIAFLFASMSPSSIMGFGPQWLFFAFALGFLNYYKNSTNSSPLQFCVVKKSNKAA